MKCSVRIMSVYVVLPTELVTHDGDVVEVSDGADRGCASGDHGAYSPTFCLVARHAANDSCFESAGGCADEATASDDESDSSCELGCVTSGASRSASDDHGCHVALDYETDVAGCGISFGDCETGVAEGWESGAALGWDCDGAGWGYVAEGWGFYGVDSGFGDAGSGSDGAGSGSDGADSGYDVADSGYDVADSGYDVADSGYDVVG
ncbi:hypothetical protein MRX96_055746 [Rhipicephalus microplus]